MNPADLAERVLAALLALDSPPLLGREGASIRSVLNGGGFVNRSFRATDGRAAYHVKVADDSGALSGLKRWRHVHETLSERYGAPALRAWIDVPDTPFSGAVFDWIEGAVPKVLEASVRDAVIERASRLHADTSLAAELGRTGAGEAERLRVYARASLLDWIIDPLADWIDAERQPEHAATVRESNRQVYERATAVYRELYPGPGGRT